MPILLLILGIVIIVLSLKKTKKKDNSFSNIIKEREENSDGVNLEIAEIRRTFGETITDLQIEIRDLKEEIELLKNKKTRAKNKSVDYNRDIISNINFNAIKNKEEIKVLKEETKGDKIRELMENNYTDDEICEKLSVGKGEVLLVRSLFKK